MCEYSVGDRVQDLGDGHRGTVLFVGSVPPTKGVWLGVDWDAGDDRGKHDGCHEGTRYFTANSQRSGSFVRHHKVTGGVYVNEALKDRYGFDGDLDESNVQELRKEIKASFVELVGFDKVKAKQSEYSKLVTVDLSNSTLRGLAPEGEPWCQNVSELNISDNLIRDWVAVGDLCCHLKRLKSLTVSGNRRLGSPRLLDVTALVNLEELIIAEMGFDWQECFELTRRLPALKTLQAPLNIVGVIGPIGDAYQRLTVLNLSSNPIADWSSLMVFSRLQHLQKMILNQCPFTEIVIPGGQDLFPSLEMLSIVDSRLKDWTSISALENVPNLRILIMMGCSLFDQESAETGRQLVIARISQLQNLNRTFVDPQERRGAEIDYLKKYGLDYLDSRDNAEMMTRFEASHPSYMRLRDLNDWNPTREEFKVQDRTLASGLLLLHIECPANPDFKIVTKKIPSTMTVSKVKLLLQRVVKQKSHQMELFYRGKDMDFEYELEHNMKDLSFYNVENEGTIIVKQPAVVDPYKSKHTPLEAE